MSVAAAVVTMANAVASSAAHAYFDERSYAHSGHGSSSSSNSTTAVTGTTAHGSSSSNTTTSSDSSSNSTSSDSSSNSTSSDSSSNSTSSISGTTSHGSSSGTSTGHSGTSGKHGHSHTSGDPFYTDVQVWMWYATCAVIGLLAIYHGYQLLQKWRRQRKAPLTAEKATEKRLKPWAAAYAGGRNWLNATAFPSWLYAPETVADALWTSAYMVVVFAITFRESAGWSFDAHSAQGIANLFGQMAFAQMPLIMFLAMKNNPISLLTGIPYQNLNYLHRAGSRCILVWSWIHTGLSTIRITGGRDSWSATYIIWGWVALAALTLLTMSSFTIVRRRLHQLFFTSHIVLAILYMVGAYIHWDEEGTWIWMCFVIWGFDRVVRWGRTIWTNRLWKAGRGECTIEVLEGDCLRLSFKRYGFTWKAGQHVFVSAPRVSKGPVEAHPFTISNASNDEHEVVILSRVYGGFTRDLLKAISSTSDKTVRAYIDGPYGQAHSLSSYDHVLMFPMLTHSTGGTGIAPWTAQMLELVNSKKHARTQLVHLVWIVREASVISWVAPFLDQAAALLKANPANIKLAFDVYVTRGSVPQEKRGLDTPTEKSGQLTPDTSESEYDTVAHLPAAPKDISLTSSNEPAHHSLGKLISPEAMSFVRFHKGRPDLKTIIEQDASTCPEAMAYGGESFFILSFCGPLGLMQTCRTALKQASNFSTVLKGQTPIDFYEETLGQ
ncbi:hypothetical protein I350_08000 [Cryptococcus amylolentus CBS 6273]|uniref:ferric-chelate reductase (NADPH) n=1 Tax=Cryptococcus amylolentus CBS 6273 TaxID=1296118 RepID=A0A1E3J858_9TREE|nr:hypothetical protein I350_08000 [Cryptococcus amylolentus CBS 6273]